MSGAYDGVCRVLGVTEGSWPMYHQEHESYVEKDRIRGKGRYTWRTSEKIGEEGM